MSDAFQTIFSITLLVAIEMPTEITSKCLLELLTVQMYAHTHTHTDSFPDTYNHIQHCIRGLQSSLDLLLYSACHNIYSIATINFQREKKTFVWARRLLKENSCLSSKCTLVRHLIERKLITADHHLQLWLSTKF